MKIGKVLMSLFQTKTFLGTIMVPKIDKTSILIPSLNLLKMFVTIQVAVILKSSFRCSGSQIEISIMKSVSEHQCERFLIYDHDDLSNLDIEINFLKKIVCGYNFSAEFLNKLCIKNAWKKLEKNSTFFPKIKIIFQIW